MKLKISKPGHDVRTASDENLVFSSDWDSLKAYAVGTTSMNFLTANATQNLDVAHALGYAPAFFVLVKTSATVSSPLTYKNLFGELSARVVLISCFSDTSKLRITVSGSAGGGDVTLNFKYYIFYNQLD